MSSGAFVREPIETEIRAYPQFYLPSSTRMHAVRALGTVSSTIRSEPAWGMGTELQRPRPGQQNAWKMDQPREGVRSRCHKPCSLGIWCSSPQPRTQHSTPCCQVCEVSPGPIYRPAEYKAGSQVHKTGYRPPIWTAQGRTPFYLMGGKGYLGRLKEHDYLKTGGLLADRPRSGPCAQPNSPLPTYTWLTRLNTPHTAQILRSLSTPAQSSRGRRGRLATITS